MTEMLTERAQDDGGGCAALAARTKPPNSETNRSLRGFRGLPGIALRPLKFGQVFLPWSAIPRYAAFMKVDKLSVSFDPDLGDAVRAAARQRGEGVSRWLADAAAAKLRTEALADFLDTWEAEHGSLTAAEMAKAAAELALPKPTTAEPAA
jgi:hypothetical protein